MKCRIVSSLVLVVGLFAACEKARAPHPKGSGTLSAAELDLFRFLPKGAPMYFAGDYSKLHDFMSGGLGQLATTVEDKLSPGMAALTKCLAGPGGMKSALSVSFANQTLETRIVMNGLKIADVARCGQDGGLKTTVDADNRFVNVELPMPLGTFDFSYYALSTGQLYMHQIMSIGQKTPPKMATRAECEAELAALGHNTAAEDADFNALASNADRTKTAWFAGSGAGTPLAEKVAEAYGSIDASTGIALDITVRLIKPADAEKLEQGVGQLRKMSDQLPASFKDVVAALKFDRSNDRVHFALALSDAQLKSVSDQVGSMLGKLH
jgi:hypothetical protein